MRSDALGKPTSADREIAIINYLRARQVAPEVEDAATVTEIWQAMKEDMGEDVTRPAYYKILDAMAAAGKIERVEGTQPAKYVVVSTMHATNRITLDDVYEMLNSFENRTEVMARAVEAQRYFFERRETVLAAAAEALTREYAPDLIQRWIEHQLKVIRADLEAYRHIEDDGPRAGEAPLADGPLEKRLQGEVKLLRDLLYRHLSLPPEAIDVPMWEGPHGLNTPGAQISYNGERVKDALKMRVFGVGAAETVLGFVEVPEAAAAEARQDMIVAGSDGSFHAGTLQIGSAQRYIEDESYVVTFNNSVAYVRSSQRLEAMRGQKKFVHSAPFRRDKLDDPTYKGMVLAPFMFPDLTPAEYEHMTRAATDVVQMRVDDEVTAGTARDVVTGELIRQPRVLFRDGTVTPQSRHYNQYTAANAYGEITREGILRSKHILERIASSEEPAYTYAGAVKTTQMKLFSRLLSWYIAIGSKESNGGQALDADWEAGRANFVSDVDAMTLLLSTLKRPEARRGFWASCVIVRRFSSLAEFYDTRLQGRTWFDVLNERRDRQLKSYEQAPSYAHLTYDVTLSERELRSDPYLYMLATADYASFYLGHTGGDPAPKIPRYEFMCSLRGKGPFGAPDAAKRFVQGTVQEMATALDVCGFTADKDHNFLSKLSLIRRVVSVIYSAHEFSKQLGKKLESEFRSSVIAKLVQHKRGLPPSDVSVRPIGMQKYIERFARAREQLPSSEREEER